MRGLIFLAVLLTSALIVKHIDGDNNSPNAG